MKRYSDGNGGIVHAQKLGRFSRRPVTLCGGAMDLATTDDRSRVSCRRCLAMLPKRDREFQRKARAWFKSDYPWAGEAGRRAVDRARTAARAIALEEGLNPARILHENLARGRWWMGTEVR